MSAKFRIPFLDFLQYLLVKSLACAVNAFPPGFAACHAHVLGDLFHFFLSKRQKTALENLAIAFPAMPLSDRKQIVRATFRHLTASFIEFFRIPTVRENAPSYFEVEGTEYLDAAFKKGKGVVFAVSHLGSWEYLSFLFYLRDYPGSVIVREIKNPYLYRWIQSLRSQTRIKPIDRVHSAKGILKALKKNEMVAILIDQWAGHNGVWVDFFGQKTSTTSIPARLALKTGAVIVPGFCIRTSEGKYKITLKPEVPVDSSDPRNEINTTLRLNQLLEEEIKKYPGQLTWTHRRLKSYERHIKT